MNHSRPASMSGAATVAGFSSAVFLWVTWFVTHLPWLGMDQGAAAGVILGVWVISFGLTMRGSGLGDSLPDWLITGAVGGLLSSVLGLLILGSKLKPQVASGGAAAGTIHPNAIFMALGFLALGVVVGLLASVLAFPFRCRCELQPNQMGRFAWVTVLAAAPLMFIGGLVTSTGSGMAVPDWPTTFGSNMFLYPLGPRVPQDIYLEHSHRLFGTLVGCATLVLGLWTALSPLRGTLKVWCGGVFALVCVQGLLGAFRVIQNERIAALVHGALAQVIFAGLAAGAVYLSAAHQAARLEEPLARARRARILATSAMHGLILQLLLGAVYRHLRHVHVLYTHIAVAVLVTGAAAVAGMVALAVANAHPDRRWSKLLRISAGSSIACVGLQFVLGWAAFGIGTQQQATASTVLEALVRTSHQANGALLLALTTCVFLLTRRLGRHSDAAEPAPSPT